ncbi:MAG: hypothetical protein LBP63_02225 [Prevotellaceae bacterium]|nr:hypothetical protein [Prevotellaceae bacterium]
MLRKIFDTKHADTNTQTVAAPTVSPKISFQALGMQKAGQSDGSLAALKPCLQAAYTHQMKIIAKNDALQQERKLAIAGNICDLEAQEKNIDIKIHNELEKLKHEEDKIEKLKHEIDDIKRNPNQITGDKFVKASFWIGAVIIIFLTIYLFIFYSSAAYSAFFKNFTPDELNIAQAIFDSQALTKAFSDGLSELILILTIPAVFLGLGYLIHKFQEQKKVVNYFKIAGLISTTFIFDAILGYEIVEKIYNVKKEGSFEYMPDMTVSMAFQQVNFWLIIFAGFVVYLIWGFVFDFIMNEYAKLDRVKYAIKTREDKISDYKMECKELKRKVNELEPQRNIIVGKINKLKQDLQGVIIHFSDVKEGINEFFAGWIGYMKGSGKTSTELRECTDILNNFINDIKDNFEPQI